jgi:hypothetical protein
MRLVAEQDINPLTLQRFTIAGALYSTFCHFLRVSAMGDDHTMELSSETIRDRLDSWPVARLATLGESGCLPWCPSCLPEWASACGRRWTESQKPAANWRASATFAPDWTRVGEKAA